MFRVETPREALLIAENNKLKAENAYLRQAFVDPGMTITPMAVVEELAVPHLAETITLPCVGSIRGRLARHGNFHVLAKLSYAQPEDLIIQYHAPGVEIKSMSDYAINNLLPYMHEKFIHALAKALTK